MVGTESKDESVRGKQAMNEQKACSEVPEKNLESLTQIIPPRRRLTNVSTGEARRKLRMEARLVIIAGANRGAIVWLEKSEILIGRETTCEVCLKDEAVSRKQCAVKADKGSFLIVDFSSRNGSFVNGVPICEKVLQHGDKIFLVYSASGCWTDAYELGALEANANADLLNPKSWRKLDHPLFKQDPAAGVFGPGHNGFFKSPDGKEDWIVYHANDQPGEGCGGHRSPRIQKFTWNGDGTPNFGTPVSTDTVLARPSH